MIKHKYLLATALLAFGFTQQVFAQQNRSSSNAAQLVRSAGNSQELMQHRFSGYNPTILNSESEVRSLFNAVADYPKMFAKRSGGDNGFRDRSQCFHRATTWQYLMDKEKGIKSQKLFVFYSNAFKRYYKQRFSREFDWWFHVAPMVLVRMADGSVQERVLDPTFANGPLTVKGWTDLFIASEQKCRDDLRFVQFGQNVGAPFEGTQTSGNHTSHCFTDRAPMYDLDPMYLRDRNSGSLQDLKWKSVVLDEATNAFPVLGPRNRFREYVKSHGL